MELDIIILPGTVLITIQDPGHGDLILLIPPILDGVSAGGTVKAGSVLVLALDTVMVDMVMDTVIPVAAGGDLPSITLPVGVAGMEVRDLMASTEIHFMSTIISM